MQRYKHLLYMQLGELLHSQRNDVKVTAERHACSNPLDSLTGIAASPPSRTYDSNSFT